MVSVVDSGLRTLRSTPDAVEIEAHGVGRPSTYTSIGTSCATGLLKAVGSGGVGLAVQCEQLIRPDVDHRESLAVLIGEFD